MKKPTRVNVGGRRYDVVYVPQTPLSDNDLLGRCLYEYQVIALQADQTPASELDSLIHEVLHAIFLNTGLDLNKDEEEKIVSVAATGWANFMTLNPDVMKYLMRLAAK